MAGSPVSNEDRSIWPIKKVVTEIKKSIRTDYGGASSKQEKISRIMKRIREYPECKSLGEQELYIICNVILREHQVVREGIAKRVANHTDELERRIIQTTSSL